MIRLPIRALPPSNSSAKASGHHAGRRVHTIAAQPSASARPPAVIHAGPSEIERLAAGRPSAAEARQRLAQTERVGRRQQHDRADNMEPGNRNSELETALAMARNEKAEPASRPTCP